MRSLLQARRVLGSGIAAVVLALELAIIAPASSLAQSAPSASPIPPAQGASTDGQACPGSDGPADYAVSGGPDHSAGWFYTEEACRWAPVSGVGPARARGFAVVDDDRANFWTEFRRFGGVDVLGYPVSQIYHYPIGNPGGYWYQAFERGILQYHPETGRAEMANAFEQFTESDPCHLDRPDDSCLDNKLLYLGIPNPQLTQAPADGTMNISAFDREQRMGWLTEPRFLARFFFDPVAFHSSEPQRPGETAFATQEQAWAFFGLPQTTAQRMVLRAPNHPSVELWPLVHSFSMQRFQKGGMQLFMEDLPPTREKFDLPLTNGDDGGIIFDPTIVPGDGKKGCVAITAVGLLARTVGVDKMIPRTELQPIPPDPQPKAFFTLYIPLTGSGQAATQFQIDGTGYLPNEPVTIVLSDGVTPGTGTSPGRPLPTVTLHLDHTNMDGSFTQVVTTHVATYTVTVTGDKGDRLVDQYSILGVDLAQPTATLIQNRLSTCRAVGLPVAN